MTSRLITDKSDMRIAVTVNRENAMTASRFEHATMKNKDKTPLRVRRNGKTKTWKTRPDEFKIPVKYGLRECAYIDHNNCNEWTVVH